MWARIDNGTVAEITDRDPAGRYHPDMQWVPAQESVAPGWTYDGQEFAAPSQPEPEIVIPQRVTRRQGRLALLEVGRLDDVENAIDAITDPTEQRAAQIEYEADTWERSNAFLQSLWAQMGGTEAELDDLFALAASK